MITRARVNFDGNSFLQCLLKAAISQVLADTHHESSDIELNLVCAEIRLLKESDAKRPQLGSV